MKKEKLKSRSAQWEALPMIALLPVIGIQRRRYENKKTRKYTILFLCFSLEVTVTKYKMVRIVNLKHNLFHPVDA